MTPTPEQDGHAVWLRESDFAEVVDRTADAVSWRMPLPVALRAAAAEAPGSERSQTLVALSERLEAGEPLDEALARIGAGLPRHLRELLHLTAHTPEAGLLFGRYAEQSRRSRDRRRRLALRLITPAILFGLTSSVVLFVLLAIVPGFKSSFTDFGTELPDMTHFTIGLSDWLRSSMVPLLIVLGVLLLAALLVAGSRKWPFLRHVVYRIPLLGPVVRTSALADFGEYLSLFVECRVPLPEAVGLAVEGTRDVALAWAAQPFVHDLGAGQPPERAALEVADFPPSLRHSFRFAANPGALAAALRAQATIFNILAENRASHVPQVINPLALLGAALFVVLIAASLFLPMFKLLNDLS